MQYRKCLDVSSRKTIVNIDLNTHVIANLKKIVFYQIQNDIKIDISRYRLFWFLQI